MPTKRRTQLWPALTAALILASVLSFVAAGQPREITYSLDDSGDTYLSSVFPDAVESSSPRLMVTDAGTSQNWTLLSFNLATALTTQDTVLRATLRMSVIESTADRWPVSLRTSRVSEGGFESRATWNLSPAMACELGTSAFVSGPLVPGTRVSFDLASVIWHWQSRGGSPMLGLLIQMSSGLLNASFTFASREETALSAPELSITVLQGASLLATLGFMSAGVRDPWACPI